MADKSSSPNSQTVMVTGANGFLASYIVQDLLAKGHTVHACVRDASRTASVQHLLDLAGASERLKLFSTGDLANANAKTRPFDVPMKGCHAVFHAATPLSVKFNDDYDGERDIYQPAMTSTQEVLDCIERNLDTVQCLVLTSSMSSVAPQPEPPMKDESHWSDPTLQRERGNWYGCTKTFQEKMVRDWYHDKISNNSKNFCYAAICPTMVIGPHLKKKQQPDNNPQESVGGTMGTLQKWLQGGRKGVAPNDSMSFIHVQDCAKMHTRILDFHAGQQKNDRSINEHHRYMSLIESLHWNDILKILKELYPPLPEFELYTGDDKVIPTQFNLENMNSLNVSVRSTKETLLDAIDYLKTIGAVE